jgi:hypothetical protein
MSKTSHLPAASCLTAIAALTLALACWVVQIELLNPAMAVTSLVLTFVSLVSGIVGIVIFRRGPRRPVIMSAIGLLLCGLPMAFWGLMLWILLSIQAGHPF